MKSPQLIRIAMAVVVSAAASQPAFAQTAPSLGTAQSFAVLGSSTVTNSGPSTVHGDLGVWPGSAVTGFPPGLIVPPGTQHAADADAMQAQMDVTTAYNALLDPTTNPCPAGHDLTGQNLGARTLTAGVYCFASSAQVTGTLTLDAHGNPGAVFIFQIGSTLTTASGATVRLINGAQSCKVFWQVGSSATLGKTTSFIGNILALTSITLTTGASVHGRTLARTGAVTLDTNDVFFSPCATVACQDSKAPTVAVTGLSVGTDRHTQVFITARDSGCGLASIVVIRATNADVSIPLFSPGTTLPIVVTSTKINVRSPSGVSLKVTDVNGNVTRFDPVDFTIAAAETLSVTNIPRVEHRVTIVNDGLRELVVSINGEYVRTVRLDPKETRTIGIYVAMLPGDNTITFEAVGGKTGRAAILVHPK